MINSFDAGKIPAKRRRLNGGDLNISSLQTILQSRQREYTGLRLQKAEKKALLTKKLAKLANSRLLPTLSEDHVARSDEEIQKQLDQPRNRLIQSQEAF